MSRAGSVCEKHQEYSPDGVCRWCPPEPKPVVERNIPFRGMELKEAFTPLEVPLFVPRFRVLPSEVKEIKFDVQIDPSLLPRLRLASMAHDPASCVVCKAMGWT